MKKFLCVLLTLIMALSVVQIAVSAYNMPFAYGNGNNRTDPNGPEILPQVTDPDRMATVAPDLNEGTWTFNKNRLYGEAKGDLPALGWNSWNPFQKQINEELIKDIADSFIRLGLDKVGYEYVIIDDGCYKDRTTAWPLSNNETNFPSGFKAMSNYIHDLGLKYGMYNNSAYRTCGGQAGAYGYEDEFAQMLVDWGVDYLKYDYCSNPWNVNKVSVGPMMRNIKVTGTCSACNDFSTTINLAEKAENVSFVGMATINAAGYVEGIGFPTGDNGYQLARIPGEVILTVEAPADGRYEIELENAAANNNAGRTFQVDVNGTRVFETMVPSTGGNTNYQWTKIEGISLNKGENTIRIYNLKNMESSLDCFAALKESMIAKGGADIKYGICEWGGTMPETWAFKAGGDSYRITSDIANVAGQGKYAWMKYQYDRAVILDKYTGFDTAWADADMMVIGLEDSDKTKNEDGSYPKFTHEEDIQHMTAWAMMNSPILLGMDLTKVEEGDPVHQVISNADVIALNQDALGIQAKRIKMSINGNPEHFTTSNRTDILAKPLYDGTVAVMFNNVGRVGSDTTMTLTIDEIVAGIGDKIVDVDKFANAPQYILTDLWTKEEIVLDRNETLKETIAAHDSKTYKITPDYSVVVDAPESVMKGESFNVSITTNADYKKFKLFNETGRAVGCSIVEKNVNEDGTVTTVLNLSVGTAGEGRTLDIVADGIKIGNFTFDVTAIEKKIVGEIAVPKKVVKNELFEVSFTVEGDFSRPKLYNETGRAVSAMNLKKTANADGTTTFTFETAIGTAGAGRTISIYDLDVKYGSFTLDVLAK